MPSSTPRASIRCEATVTAPAQVVHRALTSADAFRQWWSVWTRCELISVFVDARRGGRFEIRSRARSGDEHFHTGEYLYLGPDLIVTSWATDYSEGFKSTVRYQLRRLGRQKTKLLIEHTDLESAAERELMSRSWPHIVEVMRRGIPHLDPDRLAPSLAAYVNAVAGPQKSGR